MIDYRPELLLEPNQLQPLLGSQETVIVDLSKASVYNQAHIPNAVFLEYGDIVVTRTPVNGLLPDKETLERVLSTAGISNDTHVIAYDDEGGGKAARLLWTLECMGHNHFSLLNGGLHAWINEQHPVAVEKTAVEPAHFSASPVTTPIADTEYILKKLNDHNTVLLDARTTDEYTGVRRFSQRGGHIPGAVNIDWVIGIDQSKNMRMRSIQELIPLLKDRGITPEKEVITYCQTHHRLFI